MNGSLTSDEARAVLAIAGAFGTAAKKQQPRVGDAVAVQAVGHIMRHMIREADQYGAICEFFAKILAAELQRRTLLSPARGNG